MQLDCRLRRTQDASWPAMPPESADYFCFRHTRQTLVGAPKFVDSARFDIVAKLPRKNVPIEQLRPMVQTLLMDRFKMAFHRETREFPSYALIVDKNGPKISVTEATEGTSPAGMRNNGPGNWT